MDTRGIRFPWESDFWAYNTLITGLAWDRLGHGITKVVSEAPAVGCVDSSDVGVVKVGDSVREGDQSSSEVGVVEHGCWRGVGAT
jgi:hypothetical protein